MELKGSFIGFSFGNRHSSELGIFRTSNDNRHIAQMPVTTDVVAGIQPMDGQYYWGSTYSAREIPISFAFYGLTSEQLAQLKSIFSDKKPHSLILDEEPYKVWTAKLTGIMTTQQICLEKNGTRYYCGEGNFIFTSFSSYARSRYLYAEDYTKKNIREWLEDGDIYSDDTTEYIAPAIIHCDFSEEELLEGAGSIITLSEWMEGVDFLVSGPIELTNVNSSIELFTQYNSLINTNEWLLASRIPKKEEGYGTYYNNQYKLYNAGDIETPFQIYFEVSDVPQDFYLQCADSKVVLKNVVARENDKYIVLDSFTQAVWGCDVNYKKTKRLYNDRITEGKLFDLPVGEISLQTSEASKIEFNYLYL